MSLDWTRVADVAGALGWHAWQSSLAGLVALGLCALVRRRAPRVAALIAALALLKFIVPPIVRVPIAFGDLAALMINPFVFVPDAAGAPAWMGRLLSTATALWLTGAVLLAGDLARHALALRRLLSRAESIVDGPALDALAGTARALGLRIGPRLLISSDAEGPFATGVWRPTVVLPQIMLARLDPAALRVVLAHELVHHRRRDLPVAWMAGAATALFWFSPVAWRLARAVRELREECCDAAVIAAGVATPATYADALLAAASMPALPGALAMRDSHPLGRRLRRVLDQPRPLPPFAAGIVLALFALFCLPSTPFASPWPSGDGGRDVRVIRIVR